MDANAIPRTLITLVWPWAWRWKTNKHIKKSPVFYWLNISINLWFLWGLFLCSKFVQMKDLCIFFCVCTKILGVMALPLLGDFAIIHRKCDQHLEHSAVCTGLNRLLLRWYSETTPRDVPRQNFSNFLHISGQRRCSHIRNIQRKILQFFMPGFEPGYHTSHGRMLISMDYGTVTRV